MPNGGVRPPGGLRGRRTESEQLDRLVQAVTAGTSRVLVVCGQAGVGKTALLEYAAEHAPGCRVTSAAGVQSEMELAFAGVHQLCAPLLDRLDRLPAPQRTALRTAVGLGRGAPPDHFLVGLAVLNLLSDAAGERPLLCLVDDEQWLDHASAQVLGFVARRLAAEPVGLLFAAREPSDDLAGLPRLAVGGLPEREARALLDAALTGPLDDQVRDRIVAETGGNPLALLELPRGLTPAELAGGFALPDAVPLSASIEASFRRRLDAAPGRQPAAGAARGGRSGRRSGAGLAGGRAARDRRSRRRRRQPTPACWRSAPGCGSGIRWRARRPTGRGRCRSARTSIAPCPRRPTRPWIPTAGPGTGPRPRPDRTRRSRPSWSGRPDGRRPAAGWRRPPRSWNGRRC